MRRLDWADYRTTEFEGLDPEKVIAILPTAAIEQHGPHLPVGVDTMIAEGMLFELRRQCPDDLDIRILPVQAVGKSNEHLHAWIRKKFACNPPDDRKGLPGRSPKYPLNEPSICASQVENSCS